MLQGRLHLFGVILPIIAILTLLSFSSSVSGAEKHAESQAVPAGNPSSQSGSSSHDQGSRTDGQEKDQNDEAPPPVDGLFSPDYQTCMDSAAGVTTDMQDCINAELERLEKIVAVRQIALPPVLGEERSKSLRETLAAWDAMRKSGSATMYDPDGGTLSPLMASLWYLEQTARMVQWLNALGENPE
ncbi:MULTISPECIES: lysozyme inhibitor LprI family protein [unclassified Desulfovibrio]|uniref:lysozyme inhibitor LprI family protein n=1 Tax=unclassified Desulfovibrio TaxID=2593640 RepID=UPI002FD99EC3